MRTLSIGRPIGRVGTSSSCSPLVMRCMDEVTVPSVGPYTLIQGIPSPPRRFHSAQVSGSSFSPPRMTSLSVAGSRSPRATRSAATSWR